MCGIAGLFSPIGGCPLDIQEVSRRMVRQLTHRGPDDEGVWYESSSGVSLAHRRLSIFDLSAAGHQPMLSHCGRYVVVFNGEIYNHQAIRQELQGEAIGGNELWRGHSDTETLLAAIARWGLAKALDKSVGMFAFALWDRKEKVLHLARDRAGEKPLYYGLHKGTLLFASELKAIRAYPGFQGEVDRDALAQLLCRNVIPSPLSIYRGILKLPPGTTLTVTQDDILKGILDAQKPYWSLLDVAVTGQDNLFKGDAVEACDELERLLKQSISGQMLADVPVGAFLSGGIDSSTVVALMQAKSTRPVKTFTIGFHDGGYDESHNARAIATHLGTDHTEFYVTPEQALSVIPRLPKLYDEPFADASQIPTFLVSELAQRDVKVCLSGDGGDELFGGYNRYVAGVQLWSHLGFLPKTVRVGLARGIRSIRPAAWDLSIDRFGSILPPAWRVRTPGVKLHKIAEMLTSSTFEEVYWRLATNGVNSDRLVIGGQTSTCLSSKQLSAIKKLPVEHQMMCMDGMIYLPDDILVKVDRAAMGVSLEPRVPMLDHRVIEFAWSLPLDMKIRQSQGKWLLRKVLERHVPKVLTDRPKSGFGVPLGSWLRGPLRGWAEELLDPKKIRDQGYFDASHIRDIWRYHLDGRGDRSSQIWGILTFQAWLNEY